MQPGEILEFYRDLTSHSGFELETAGVLREGRKFWALARTGQSTTLKGRDKVDGRERVLIAATLNQTRWRLVGVAYLDELLVLHTAFVHILTVVLICALLLSLAVATMMSYRLMRPIRHVADAIGRVESGKSFRGDPGNGISGSTRHFRVL